MSTVLPQTDRVASGNAKEVGRRVKEARQSARLTQQDLADRIGITSTQVSRWERGVVDIPLYQLERVSEITRTPLRHFFPRPQTAEGLTLEQMMAQLLETVGRIAEGLELLERRLVEPDNDGVQLSGD